MKKNKTALEKLDSSHKIAKRLEKIAPIVFWCCLILGALLLYLAIRNSIGNIVEIVTKLDNKAYTGEELQANYEYLIKKYGEWRIGNGGAGFEIEFVNISKALFSGFAIVSGAFSIVFFACSYLLGKWLLPKLAEQIKDDSEYESRREILKSIEKNNCEN